MYASQEELDRAVAMEDYRIGELIGELGLEFRSQEINDFRKANDGHHPPYMETVGIGNRTMLKAQEIILDQELEVPDQVWEDEDEDSWVAIKAKKWAGHPDRWKEWPELIRQIDPEIDGLTDEIWPDRSIRWRVTAGCLMQTRYEDRDPYPESPDDPLVPLFTALVDEHLDELARSLGGRGM